MFAIVTVLVALAVGVQALLTLYPTSLPRTAEVTVDPIVLLFTLAVSLLTGVVFGLAPLMHTRAAGMVTALKEGGDKGATGAARHHLRRGLVMAEVALAVMLVIGAGLLLRTVANLTNVDAGFDRSRMVTFSMALAAVDDLDVTKDISRIMAEEARAIGVNWSFTPVIDINAAFRSAIVATRGFGSDVEVIARHALDKIPIEQSQTRVQLIIDRSKSKDQVGDFNAYVARNLTGRLDPRVPLDIYHHLSYENVGLQAVDDRPGLLARTAMRLLDFNLLPCFGLPFLDEGFVDLVVKLARRVIRDVEERPVRVPGAVARAACGQARQEEGAGEPLLVPFMRDGRIVLEEDLAALRGINEDVSLDELAASSDLFGRRIVGIEPENALMEAVEGAMPTYGLGDWDLEANTTGDMLDELSSAVEDEEPIVVPSWRPHWIYAAYDLRDLADRADLLLLDGAMYRRAIFSHLRIDEAVPVVCGWRVQRILLTGLHLYEEGDTARAEQAIAHAGRIEMAFLEKGLVVLATVSNVAPLIGFLGTVAGMIIAFGAIEAAGEVEAQLVAGGIKVALITTAAGLVIAIPINVALAANVLSDGAVAYADAQQLANLVTGFHKLGQRTGGPLTYLAVPRSRGFKELGEFAEFLLGVFVGLLVLVGFGHAIAQHGQGGIYLALLAFIHHHAKHLPHVFHALEVIPFVTQHMDELDDAPALKFPETVADVRSRNAQRPGKILVVQRLLRDEEQGVNLGHTAVDAPARTHLDPVQDELLLDWCQFCHCDYFCLYRSY